MNTFEINEAGVGLAEKFSKAGIAMRVIEEDLIKSMSCASKSSGGSGTGGACGGCKCGG